MTETDSSGREHRRLFALLALSLGLRLAWGQLQSASPALLDRLPDQREYLQLATSFLHGDGFRFYDPRFHADVFAYRTPGYPLFLAACGGLARVARAAQAMIDTSTVLAVYLLARRWLDQQTSLLAAAWVALNPFLIYMSGLILSETLFTSMLMWGMLLVLGRGGVALIGGMLMAVAVLVRPSGVALPVLLFISAAVLNRGPRGAYSHWWPRGWPLPPASTALLMILAVLLPWAYRNDKLLGKWIWMTTNSGITAYDGFNDEATGASDQRFATSVKGLGHADEVQRDTFFSEAARQWVRLHPRRAMELAAVKVARTWSPIPLSADYGRPLYRIAGAAYAVPFDLMVILALLRKRPRLPTLPRMAKAFLLLPAIYFTAIHALSVGSLRYRLPAEPPLAVLAAVGCAPLLAGWQSRYRSAGLQTDGKTGPSPAASAPGLS